MENIRELKYGDLIILALGNGVDVGIFLEIKNTFRYVSLNYGLPYFYRCVNEGQKKLPYSFLHSYNIRRIRKIDELALMNSEKIEYDKIRKILNV